MNDSQIDDAVREMARRWYFNGSLDGGLGRDTDEAEKRHVDIHATIKQMALFGTALASRVRAAEQERCAVECDLMADRDEQAREEAAYQQTAYGHRTVAYVAKCAHRVKAFREAASAIRAPRPERQA